MCLSNCCFSPVIYCIVSLTHTCLAPKKDKIDEPGEGSAQKTDSSPSKVQQFGAILTKEQLEDNEKKIMLRHNGVFDVHGKTVLRDKKSLFIFDRDWRLRIGFVWFVEWCWFDRFITFVILLNSLLLAFTDYQERVEPSYVSPRNEFFAKVDVVFSIIFLCECASKLIALGFCFHK